MLFFTGMNDRGIPLTLTLSLQGRENFFLFPLPREEGWAGIQRGFTPAGIWGTIKVNGKFYFSFPLPRRERIKVRVRSKLTSLHD
jgi:hypothetical protein